jgi:predicted lipoprotein with Yx(FWY)xxD motif
MTAGRRARLRRRTKILLTLAAMLLAVSGLLAYGYFRYIAVQRYTVVNGRLTVRAQPVNGLGTVLVTNKGYALYMFPPDAAKRVTCTGDCARGWPPLVLPDGARVVAGPGIRAALLGTVLAPTASMSSPTRAGRYTPTSATPIPATPPDKARTTTVGTGTRCARPGRSWASETTTSRSPAPRAPAATRHKTHAVVDPNQADDEDSDTVRTQFHQLPCVAPAHNDTSPTSNTSGRANRIRRSSRSARPRWWSDPSRRLVPSLGSRAADLRRFAVARYRRGSRDV